MLLRHRDDSRQQENNHTDATSTISEVTAPTTQLTEFRQPLQVQSHLEMPRILVQLGHTQRT